MVWKGAQCGADDNPDDMTRCTCGFDASRAVNLSETAQVQSGGKGCITGRRKVVASLAATLLLLIASQFAGKFLAWVTYPGIIINYVVSGDMNEGVGGILGWFLTIAGSGVTWFVVAYSCVSLWDYLFRLLTRK
jgi:hypothetical protein